MRKIYLFAVVTLLLTTNSFSQSATWNGFVSNDFTLAANWTPNRNTPTATDVLTFNPTAPLTIENIGTQTIAGIVLTGAFPVSLEAGNPATILSLNGATPLILSAGGSLLVSTFLSVQINSAASISTGTLGIVAGSGGKIVINNNLNLNGGTLDVDVPSGNTSVLAAGTINYTAGVFNCINTDKIIFFTGAKYIHGLNGLALPAATWSNGSFCTITGITNTAPTGLSGIDFANFTWNCPSQSANIDLVLPATTFNISGALSILSTNNQYLRFAGPGTVRAGSYTQTGSSNLMLQSQSGNNTLTVKGTFSHTAGTIDGVGNGSGGTALLDLKGDVIKLAAWDCSSLSSTAVMTVQFSGGTAQTVNTTGGSWEVNGGGRCNITITNNAAGGVALTAGSLLKVINKSNSAAATCSMGGILTAAAGAYVSYGGTGGTTLLYNGISFQTATATEFPASAGPKNLTINNNLGVKFPVGPGFSRDVPGTLNMLGGNLAIELGNTLSLTNTNLSAQLAYTAGYITTGTLGRWFPSTGLPTTPSNDGRFPFGTGINERSLNLYFSSSNGGTAGMVNVSHSPIVNVTGLSIADNGVTLDKRTNTKWDISTGSFTLGAATVALQAIGENIGAIDSISPLRLTDGISSFGNLVGSAGSTSRPIVGKSGLGIGALNTALYIGSAGLSGYNPLRIITYTWIGSSVVDNNWKDPTNWSGGAPGGYPSAPTEIAIITNTSATWQPYIDTTTNVSVYQLSLGAGMNLGMAEGSVLTVYDTIPLYGGSTNFAPGSTFGYAAPAGTQNVRDFALGTGYGNLTLSGNARKSFPAFIRVKGVYSISGDISPILNSNKFIYEGPASQYITPAKYYDLTITGNRGGGVITLGYPLNSFSNTINIGNDFDVSGLSNFIYPPLLPLSFTTVYFSSPTLKTIPGFRYPFEVASVNAPRKLDPSGSADSNHVIYCRTMDRGTGSYDVVGSKVNLYVSGSGDVDYNFWEKYYDLEISGDLKNKVLGFLEGPLWINGDFKVSLTNYRQKANNTGTYFIFNGIGNQTINGSKTVAASNTPAFKYPNIIIGGGNRNVTLGGIDTIKVTGTLQVPRGNDYTVFGSWFTVNVNKFDPTKGFSVAGSTVNFSVGSDNIPVLIPASGTDNYNNITVTGGTRILEGNLQLKGNLTVGGGDLDAAKGISPAVLKLGDGISSRVLTVLGDTVTVAGTSATSKVTGQIDLNSGTTGSTTMNLSGSLFINGQGQMMNTGATNGNVIFKGVKPHNYLKTSSYNNDSINFTVGDGVTSSKLTLLSNLDLVGSGTTPAKIATLSVLATDTLDCGTNNVYGLGTDGFAKFDLKADATLVTANTGGVEGAGTNSSTGSIRNDLKLVRSYDAKASYVLNAVSNANTGFPTSVTPFPMANLTFGNDVNTATISLNQHIDISNTLTLKKYSTPDLTSKNINLKSGLTSTARIAPVPDQAFINYSDTGRFVVERYYPGRRAWRLITAPVSVDGSTKSVFDSWQMGGAVTIGSGMYVTGPGANPGSNGLDVSPQNNFSLKYFDGTNLVGVPDTRAQKISGNLITPGVPANIGLFAFVRGDRSSTSLFNVSVKNNTTLRDTGKVQIKSQVFTLPGAVNSYALVGNPYASPVNITDFLNASTNINKSKIWIWDPNLNIEQGGYVTYTYSGGFWVPDVPSTTFPAGHIQSSQAFFVEKTSALDGTIPFAESHKSTNNSNGAFRPMAQPAMFRTILNLREANDSSILADGNLVIFDDTFNAAIDDGDAFKFGNIKENFGLLRDTKLLAIERRPTIVADDTLFFRLTKVTQRKYEFQFEPTNMDPLLTGFLEDNYTGIKTPVSLTATTSFNFVVNGDAKSAAADRFRIVFKTTGAGPLPVTYSSIKAYQQNKDIIVDWTVENEMNTIRYEVEKSTDGVSYFKINAVNAKGTNSSSTNYKFLDQNVSQGNNFYRILSYGQDGKVEYSRILLVKIGKASGAGISIYPNPVTDNNIGLSFNNLVAGVYNVRVINTIGQVVLTKAVNHSNGNSIETINSNVKLNTGIYQVEVTSPADKTSVVKMIVQ